MDFFIRHQELSDLELLENCLNDTEFITNIWGHRKISSDDFLCKYSFDNYVIGKQSNIDLPLGFFIIKPHNIDSEELDRSSDYFFYGGIRPVLFNSGLGIFLCATALLFFFKMYPISNLYANVFMTNCRSKKMLLALGFKIFRENYDSVSLRITRNEFLSSYMFTRIGHKLSYKLL